jgi:hypothetical protein
LYFSNASTQWLSVNGGMAPSSGFHSVMDSPESVSRVAPPTITMQKIRKATAQSQIATAGEFDLK